MLSLQLKTDGEAAPSAPPLASDKLMHRSRTVCILRYLHIVLVSLSLPF